MKIGYRGLAPASMLALSCLLSPGASAAEDEAVDKACPEFKAWKQAHPHREEATEAAAGKPDSATMPELRAELKKRVASDQRVREEAMGGGGPLEDKAMQAWLAVDRANLEWLKQTLAKHGFPTVEQVGKGGVADAFVLVQHADADPLLQQSVLESLRPRLATSGISKQEYAMLTDRVLDGQGKPQRYGTQYKREKDGSYVLKETEDMAHLEERRQQMDLMPVPVYECAMRASLASD